MDCGFAARSAAAAAPGRPGFVWVNKAEIETLAAALRLEVAEFERRCVRAVGVRKSLIELANGDCIFFHRESRTCRVYKERPRQCRTWPFLGLESRHAGRLGADVRQLSRRQSRPAVPYGKNSGPAERDEHLTPNRQTPLFLCAFA